jgi:hypothetical protein
MDVWQDFGYPVNRFMLPVTNDESTSVVRARWFRVGELEGKVGVHERAMGAVQGRT